MNIETVTIGSNKYNVAKASAVKQKELLTLIGARVALNSATSRTETIDANLVYGVLLTSGEAVVDQIADIVLYQCVEFGGRDILTIDNFQNRTHEYFMLIAESVGVNLNDFFIYLDSVNAETARKGVETNH